MTTQKISLAGDSQAQSECKHFWAIVCSTDINPATGRAYGQNTPGTCVWSEEDQQGGCGKVKMFDSKPIEHSKDDFKVESQPEE